VEGARVAASLWRQNSATSWFDLDPEQMLAKNISASDVSSAFNQQNVILPAGTAKMGEREYNVRLNSSPAVVDELNDLPIKEVNGAMVYIRDIKRRGGFHF